MSIECKHGGNFISCKECREDYKDLRNGLRNRKGKTMAQDKKEKLDRKGITPEIAKKVLEDGMVKGRKLSKKQIEFFKKRL